MPLRRSSHKPNPTFEVEVAGRTVSVDVSAAAVEALAARTTPLVAEAEILFSCLVRKRLTFRDWSPDLLSWPVSDALHVVVRPVAYELCLPEGGGTIPNVVDIPVADIAALIPSRLQVDLVDGAFAGSFGYG